MRRVAQQTLSSVSGRLQRYENYMANEKSKSLIRLLDKANELSRCLAQETADRSGFLADYVHQQRLTGVILLDGRSHMETRFPEDPIPSPAWISPSSARRWRRWPSIPKRPISPA